MARGENNLLFNPPRIRRESSGNSPSGRQGLFPSKAQSLILRGQDIILANTKGPLLLLDGSKNLDQVIIGQERDLELTANGKLAASPSDLAWESDQGVAVLREGHSLLVLPPLPGDILGLHLSEKNLYCLWKDNLGSHLSTASIYPQGPAAWQEVQDYGSLDTVHMENKGDRTMLYYENNSDVGKVHSVVTLSPFGLGGSLEFFHSKVIGPNQRHLISPTGEGEAYLAFGKTWHNDTELLLLYPQRLGDRDGKRLGRASEKSIATASNFKSTSFKELATWKGQGLLFGDRELILFDAKGIKEILPLSQEITDRYDRLLFSGNRALLWKEGSAAYFEIDLSPNQQE